MSDKKENSRLSNLQSWFLTILRFGIGWHFLYEGVSKILIPSWTSAPYLQNSRWIFAPVFHWIAGNGTVLLIVDWMNIIGLTLVGLALVLGIFTRLAGVSGILLLLLYYVANPPFIGLDFGLPSEGHYLFFDKNMVEMLALLAIMVFPGRNMLGLDRILSALKSQKSGKTAEPVQMDRRNLMMNLLSVPALGVFAAGTVKKYQWESINSVTGASIKLSDSTLKDVKGEMPTGKIKDFEISRLIMGGNLVGGWAHARDLIYASQLFKAYNHEKKIMDTLQLAELAGINAMNVTGIQLPVINKYRRLFKSDLKVICQVFPTKDEPKTAIDYAIDHGADLLQIQGNCCDVHVRDHQIDVLANAIDYIREQGYVAGLGAHAVQALMAADKAGIVPDFYMKTLHHDQYWSAHPKENRIPFQVDGKRYLDHDQFHDNMFCLFPDESIEFMKNKKIPWIGFKVLAGGAIHPEDGFQFAFENGTDFICVGMFDWQIVDDVNVTLDVIQKTQNRARKWMG